MAVTWNPSDKGANVNLSGGDLTVSVTNPSTDGVRATVSKSSGKWYFEFTMATVSGSSNISVGVANGSWSVSGSRLGTTANGVSYRPDGQVWGNGANIATVTAWANGDVIAVAFDLGADEVRFYRNNTLEYTATGANAPTGPLYPAVSGDGAGLVHTAVTNFGATALTYTPPSGFSHMEITDFTHAMTGGVSISSDTTFFPSIEHDMTGGVSVGSDFTYELSGTFIHEMTGGVKVAGSPVISEAHPIPTDPVIPFGGVVFGGSATVKEVIPYFPAAAGALFGGAATVLDRVPYIPTGGVVWGGTVLPNVYYMPAVSGGVVWAGTQVFVTKYKPVPSGGVVWTATAPVTMRVSLHVPSGGVVWNGTAAAYKLTSGQVVTPENPYADPFPGWMVNTENGAASRYLGLPATSIAQFGGETYITTAAGVYRLDGTADVATAIKASVELPTTDFSDSHDKLMEVAYVGIKTTGQMKLRVAVNGWDPFYFFLMPTSSTHKGTRIPIGKGLRGRYWGTRIDNVAGAKFSLDSAEFVPRASQRHGA